MRRIVRQPRRIDPDAYRKRSAREDDVDEVVTDSFTLRHEDGSLQAAYFAGDTWDADQDAQMDAIFGALLRIKYEHGTRAEGLVNTSRVFGWKPRLEFRQDFCSATSLAYEQPDEHAIVASGALLVGAKYRDVNPYLYGKHAALVEAGVLPDYQMEDEVFTSGIINENNPLKYHFDRGNFEGVWSGMLAFRRDTEAGYLALPAYNMAVGIGHKSLFLFDGQGILHGVTPIRLMTPDAKRYSIVYYSLQRMWQCQEIGAEVQRTRRVRTQREVQRAEQRRRTDTSGDPNVPGGAVASGDR
jgi:hypothetical protein